MCEFSHLHCHTQYSLLDGAARIKSLMARVSEMEMPAIAITDHGNLYGVPEFHAEATKYGIKPIIGCEFYVTPDAMDDRTSRVRYHQVLLAKNEVGYRNLIQLSSLSYTDGYYYKPRIDKETLRKYSEGLVATTCCLQGEVLQTILHKGEAEARKVFEKYLDIFGDDYYVEIQDHGIPDQKTCNHVLLKWAAEYGVTVIATNDVHYIHQEDAAAQDVLLCLQTGKDLADPNRMRFENDQFYLKSAADMELALAGVDEKIRKASLVNTLEIVDKCSFEIPMGNLLMPHYPIPSEFADDMDAYLRHLVFEKARERYPEMPAEAAERLEHELSIIKTMGYAGYFLIVQDFTSAARKLDVSVGPGRGSAAGSAVAYCLGITNIDPLKYNLLFERFLNPDRVSMPDIDIDFDDRGRSKVIDYVVQKYGRDNVCQIVTFGTMGARSVIRDVSRVLGIPLQEADRIAKLVPEGVKVSLDRAAREVSEFRELKNHDDQQIRNLIHYAEVLEGSARHTGVHAAGVIITPGRVSDYVPVSVTKGKSGADDVVTTQYDGKWVEEFGLLKMDFLGLKTLTVLKDAVKLIEENHGTVVDVDAIPLDDKTTLELFQKGDTVSIFQFESDGMREWLRKLKPTSFDDLIAMNALYRPGPMDLIPNYIDRKHGREKVSYPHEILEPILQTTYGIPVYQEQVMEMAQVMGGYTLGQADLLRRAMGKKKQEEMDKQKAIFVAGALERDVPEKAANEVFDMMAKFAGYGFNKSHSAAYSLVAFHTAYLKAHYPAEFMAAAMTNEMGDTRKLANVLEDGRRMGLEILAPSINKSEAYFTVDNGNIRFGLGAIKGVGRGAIEAIVEYRESAGNFSTIFELTEGLDLRSVNKKALDSLARAGAMDILEGHRAQLVDAIDIAVQHGQKVQAEKAAGQNSLFGGSSESESTLKPKLPATEPWSRARLLKEERDLIGVYVSGHPLQTYLSEARSFSSASFADTDKFEGLTRDYTHSATRPTHRFCGIITEVQTRTTRSGKPMAFATIEDFSGQGELVCFATVLDRIQQYLKVDEIVLAIGHPEVRGGSIKVVVNDIYPMWKVRENLIKSIVLRIREDQIDIDILREFEKLCDENRGNCKLYFDIDAVDLPKPQRVHSRKFVVEPTNDLMSGMARLFGRENIVLEGEA
ncbi:MAG: DNA polymerase III subunit alpha [Rhodothermales bacterium]|nr:DNA polymerase III subunit alpha [Rhodothermales bacterium]